MIAGIWQEINQPIIIITVRDHFSFTYMELLNYTYFLISHLNSLKHGNSWKEDFKIQPKLDHLLNPLKSLGPPCLIVSITYQGCLSDCIMSIFPYL